MTDGQGEWTQAAEASCDEPCRPSERDMIQRPDPRLTADGGCLQCREHPAYHELLYGLRREVAVLEARVRKLEEGT